MDVTEKIDALKLILKDEIDKRDKICEKIAAHSQLKQTIESITKIDSIDGLRTQVNVGSNFYVQAHVPDTSRIYVDIGLDLQLEFTLAEAKIYCEKKIEFYTNQLDESSKRSAKIKSNIKFLIQALREYNVYKTPDD